MALNDLWFYRDTVFFHLSLCICIISEFAQSSDNRKKAAEKVVCRVIRLSLGCRCYKHALPGEFQLLNVAKAM